MTLEQLRIFMAVAEREHVTRAAVHLNLTQSAVSHAVTQLEREFGLDLFSRVGRRIELTDAGTLFLDEARGVLERAAVARERLLDLGSLRDGALRVHASHTIAGYWLPARLNAFQAAYPRIRLQVAIANTREICRRVQAGEASIGLVEGDPAGDDLCRDVVALDRMMLVVAPGHPWAAAAPLPAELTRSAWVLREAGSGTRQEVERGLAALGVDPRALVVAMEIASNEAVASAVETGMAATILSASVVAGRLEAGLLHHVKLALPDRRFFGVRHRERRLSPSARAFFEMLGLSA